MKAKASAEAVEKLCDMVLQYNTRITIMESQILNLSKEVNALQSRTATVHVVNEYPGKTTCSGTAQIGGTA
jgi:hypothetical protein